MAAAVALHEAGAAVTLVESRKSLGGRAGSFEDPQTGEVLDNCQHVLLGCCTNLLDFYHRLGVSHLIRYDKTVHFLDPAGGSHRLGAVPGLPAPLHLGPSFAKFRALTLRERAALSRAMLAMLRLGRPGRLALGDMSFGQWLKEHGQSEQLIDKLYDPILVGSLNEDCRKASAAYAIQVFQDALLAHASGYVIGLANCPLADLYAKLPCPDVRLSTRVAAVRFTGSTATGVELSTGEFLAADAVVLATNHHAVRRWIPDGLAARDSRLAHLDKLQSVPILGAHLWFDRPVLRMSHAAFMQGPLQWLFRKNSEGSAVHGVISAARAWLEVPKETALAQFEQHVRSVVPGAKDAKLIRGVIVIEKRATFAPVPGIDRLRPRQAPPGDGIANLYLAGDYTLTGWPATMEGAVRSGYLAADEICRALAARLPAGRGRSHLVADLPIQWPARWMGHRGE